MKKFLKDVYVLIQDATSVHQERQRQEEERKRYARILEKKELVVRLLNAWLQYLASDQNFRLFQGRHASVMEHDGTFYTVLPVGLELNREKALRLERQYRQLCRVCWDEFLASGQREINRNVQRIRSLNVRYSELQYFCGETGSMLQKVQADVSLEPDHLRQAQFFREIRDLEKKLGNLQREMQEIVCECQKLSNSCDEIAKMIHLGIRPTEGCYNRQPSNKLFILKIE